MDQEQRQQEQEEQQRRMQQFIGKSVKRQLGKTGKKAIKATAKAAVKGIGMILKGIFSFLLKLLGPYILIAVGIVFLAIIVFSATTMIFSFGSDDLLDEQALEIREYTEKTVLASVDQNRPEQLEYAVPAELVYSILQLFNSEKRTEREIHEAINIVVGKLKPKFEYGTVTERTQTETTTCDDSGCTTSTSQSKNEYEYLSRVEAWNGTLDVDMEGSWGAWTTTTTSHTVPKTDEEGNVHEETVTVTTRVRSYTYNASENWVEDYTAYEHILTNDPFNYKQPDLIFIEQLFKMAGGEINYSRVHLGIDDGSGLDGNINFGDVNVIPGAGVPAEYMQYYLAGEKAYGINWFLLAAVHYTETKFSTHKPMISYAGAEGNMQFMPCTWVGWSHPSCTGSGKGSFTEAEKESVAMIKKYGGYGVDADKDGKASMWSLADSIVTAAKYLASAGGYNWENKESVKKALFRYNHSDTYVNNVISKAEEFKNAATYVDINGGGNAAPGGGASTYGFIAPTTGVVTSSWGNRIVGGKPDIHRAMDIGGNYKKNIYSIANGTITKVHSGCGWGHVGNKCGGGWGNHVRITHNINGTQFESIYAHMETVVARKGQAMQGQVLGTVGSSGSSTGPHLHIELHSPKRAGPDGKTNALNPIKYLPPIPAS